MNPPFYKISLPELVVRISVTLLYEISILAEVSCPAFAAEPGPPEVPGREVADVLCL